MIVLTRLNNSRFAVNADLIERVHSSPDTTIVLVDGATFIVTETMEEVIDLVAAYRARVITIAYSLPAAGPVPRAAPMHAVPHLAEPAEDTTAPESR